MPVDIIESFKLGTDQPLDFRYVVDTFNDVSLYWYPGMQVYQLSDQKFYIYTDNSAWINIPDVTYVDGSLAQRDASIEWLNINKPSFEYVDGSLNQRDVSIAWLDDNKIDIAVLPTLATKFYVDGSLNARDLSINYLYQQTSLGVSKIYVDGSLAARDASISNLYSIKANKIDVDASLLLYATNASTGLALAQRDVSIAWLNTNKVNKFGDTMTGTLNINASLNVLNDVSFGSGLYVHGARGVRIDSSLGVLGDVSIGKSLRIGNDSSIGRNLPYLQLDVSNGNKVVTAGNYYGQEYQLASALELTSTNSTSPQTKLTMNTTNLPDGTYKVIFHWMWNRNSAANSARFDIQLNGATQGTTGTIEMEAKDTTDWSPETRTFYWALSGANTITFRYWGESVGNSTYVSDATIELIRVK